MGGDLLLTQNNLELHNDHGSLSIKDGDKTVNLQADTNAGTYTAVGLKHFGIEGKGKYRIIWKDSEGNFYFNQYKFNGQVQKSMKKIGPKVLEKQEELFGHKFSEGGVGGAAELVIGEEKVDPGVVFIFEAAMEDHISPDGSHLPHTETDVHIEARANWDENGTTVDEGGTLPNGTPAGGFVAYLRIMAKITNENNPSLRAFVDVTPHINLIDNYHYARNVALPGTKNDKYTVEFTVIPPSKNELALHSDWAKSYGDSVIKEQKFTYNNVDFKAIVDSVNNSL